MSSQKCNIKQLYKSFEHRTNSVLVRRVQLIKFLILQIYVYGVRIIINSIIGIHSEEIHRKLLISR